jgi:hypothetical protein
LETGFRRSFAEEYGRVFLERPQEKQKMIDDRLVAASDYDDFIAAIYAPYRE